jgi:hypothetical protein
MTTNVLNNIKYYHTNRMALKDIANMVPTLISNSLRLFKATTLNGISYPIGYDGKNIIEFQINLGTSIATQNFNNIYEIMIRFLSSYSYMFAMYQYFIKFTKEDLNRYESICNSFKGKEWDDIVLEFSDATYDFFSKGTMSNNKLS